MAPQQSAFISNIVPFIAFCIDSPCASANSHISKSKPFIQPLGALLIHPSTLENQLGLNKLESHLS